jgi:predicted nucleic acid-binding protein
LILLDTSVVVRYITGDPPDEAALAARVVEGEEDVTLTDVVIAETAFVLSRNYRHERAEVVDALAGLVGRENVRTWPVDKGSVLNALALSRPSGRVSIPDGLTWAAARHLALSVVTFDRRFPQDDVQVQRLT